jgi:hypothetical protein
LNDHASRITHHASAEAHIRAVKAELARRYLTTPGSRPAARTLRERVAPGPDPLENVVGLGVGEKVVADHLAGVLCVKVYVRRKYLRREIPPEARIPATIDGVPTDVDEVGRVSASQPPCSVQRRLRQRPAPGGVSVGHLAVTAGTIGAVVRDSGREDNGRRYLLSNNHVLANSNDAAPGDLIFQPGPLDGGMGAEHRIATLSRFARLNFLGRENTVDGAIAEVADGAALAEICSIGPLNGAVRPARDLVVIKHGRTTGLTKGVITDVDADIRVDYDEAGVALFVNTVVIRGLPPTTPFSAGGDSGAVIVECQGRRACALLFAGSGVADVTFANPIQAVLRRLRIRLL